MHYHNDMSIHEFEPELEQKQPRAIRFDVTYGAWEPSWSFFYAFLFFAVLAYFMITKSPIQPMNIVGSLGMSLLIAAPLIIAAFVNSQRMSKLRKLIEYGTPCHGRVTHLVDGGQLYPSKIEYEYSREGQTVSDSLKTTFGRNYHHLHNGSEITVMWHPEYGHAIYKLCSYKAIAPGI